MVRITLTEGLNHAYIKLTPVAPVVTVADIRAYISKMSPTNAEYLTIALNALIAYKETGSRTNLGYWDVVKMHAATGVKWCATFVEMVIAAGLEPGPVVLNWGAFAAMLDRTLGRNIPNYTVPEEEVIISNAYGFATYVAQKFVPSAWLLTTGPQMEDYKQLGYAMLKVGLEHSELLGQGALSFHAPIEMKWGQDGAFTTWIAKFGVMPYAGFSWEDKAPLITSPTQESPEMVTIGVNRVAYIGQQAGVGPFVDYIFTYKVNNWVMAQGYGSDSGIMTNLFNALLSIY